MDTMWRAGITGDTEDLEYLCSQLKSGPVRVCKDGDEYGIAMDAFEGLDPNAMFELAKEQLPSLNGSLRLLRDSRQAILITHMRGYEGDKKRAIVVADTANLTVTARAVIAGAGSVNGALRAPPKYQLSALVSLAHSSPAVADALRLSNDQTWVGLYRLYEVIEQDVGGLDSIATKNWATRPELREFKHTANSPGAIGDDARHGRESTTPPKNPMSIEAARELLNRMLRRWIAEKNPDAI